MDYGSLASRPMGQGACVDSLSFSCWPSRRHAALVGNAMTFASVPCNTRSSSAPSFAHAVTSSGQRSLFWYVRTSLFGTWLIARSTSSPDTPHAPMIVAAVRRVSCGVQGPPLRHSAPVALLRFFIASVRWRSFTCLPMLFTHTCDVGLPSASRLLSAGKHHAV